MKKKKILKMLFLVGIFVLCFILISNTSNAEINSQYAQNSIQFDDSESIIEKIMGFLTSLLLKLLGYAIFGVTWCIEKLVAGIISLLTNMKMFPWADLTIFNGMPILDVNFINPAKNSLFKGDVDFTGIGNTIRSIYFSGLSIALGFLGIVVAVMAIRLAISSIAADKAKYKEAIVHWATAIVLIFGMHYVISFVFYLNEQLVEVASSMVQQILTNNKDTLSFLGGDVTQTSSITLMGEYFKKEAIDMKNLFNVNTFTYSVLYAVFVFQSIMFFWAYFKRFFYVLILALISPFVVIYDFLTKSVS